VRLEPAFSVPDQPQILELAVDSTDTCGCVQADGEVEHSYPGGRARLPDTAADGGLQPEHFTAVTIPSAGLGEMIACIGSFMTGGVYPVDGGALD
jgi:hypothetical protein